jgi:hypothetical protein
MSDNKKIPNPGSDEAVALGCSCPIMDNSYGAGYMGMEDTFIYNQSCELHNTKEEPPKENDD